MKKLLCIFLILSVMLLCSCSNDEYAQIPPEEKDIKTENAKIFPQEFKLENLKITVNEIIETKNVEFNEGNTKVRLNNDNGKYILINYTVVNNEEYETDIDHSVEVTVLGDSSSFFGEYYEKGTGKENAVIKPNESKEITFVCDVDSLFKFEKAQFKYKDSVYELEK